MTLRDVPLSVNNIAVCMRLYLLDNSAEINPQRKRPIVLICPGGAYEFLSAREAEPVALRMLAEGFHAAVLHYSVAPSRYPQALAEIAQAVATLREHAAEWQIQASGIVVMGFSAGGHLAASLGTGWNRPGVADMAGRTARPCRPDGLVLCYPIISMGEAGHEVSRDNLLGPNSTKDAREATSVERQVSGDMPPAFVWHTFDDAVVPVENSLLLAAAMRRAGVPLELHIYPRGPHGLSLATAETARQGQQEFIQPHCAGWVGFAADWIRSL